ncbi:hypothetical protein FRC05_004234 [Tulasnella sp. 425]|nr:hypothetical protein FRC05_004234 [Tulasnella sp. 425]
MTLGISSNVPAGRSRFIFATPTDGGCLVLISEGEQELKVWDMKKPSSPKTFTVEGTVHAIVCSPDGRIFCTVQEHTQEDDSTQGFLRLWNSGSLRCVAKWEIDEFRRGDCDWGAPTSFSRNGSLLATSFQIPIDSSTQAEEDLLRMMMELTSYLGLTEETGLSRAPITLLAKNLGAFFDTLPPFRRYLHVNGVASASSSVGIKERKAPRIVPSRFGVEIEQFDSPRITINREQFYFTGHILFPSCQWHERLIEFEVVEVPIKDPVAQLFAPSTILWSIVVILVVYFFW